MEENQDVSTYKNDVLKDKTEAKFIESEVMPLTCHVEDQKYVSDNEIIPVTEITWKNISYSVHKGFLKKEKKTIIKNVSGQAFSGELTAVMGPSGSGKSTLLNIISGYSKRNVSGDILINGCNKNLMKTLSCYIMQGNAVLPHLTVKEHITFAANLKLPESLSSQEKKNIVSNMISLFGLENSLNTKSNHLSGGESRRLNIAVELVSKPPVIFLDEPTSGLDILSCLQCIKLLKQFAEQGHNIICSIHQPSTYLLSFFDKLYILSNGESIYQGTVSGLLPFLSSHGLNCPQYYNPADFVIEIASGAYGNSTDQLKEAVKYEDIPDCVSIAYSPNGQNCISSNKITLIEKHRSSPYVTSSWSEFKVLLNRTYKSVYRNPVLTHLRLLLYVMIGLVMGTCYWKIGNKSSLVLNNSGFIFLSMLFVLFMSMMPTVITFPMEMSVYLKERHNNWHRSYIFYLARTIIELPFQVAFTCLYCAITYWMSGQPNEFFRFALFCLNFSLLSALSQCIGLISGSISGLEVAVFVAPAISVPVMLFSNYFLKINSLPVYIRWISYISYFKYNFQIIVQTIYGYDRPNLDCDDVLFCHFISPKQLIESLGVEDSVVMDDIIVLLAFFFIIRILGYAVLQWNVHRRS